MKTIKFKSNLNDYSETERAQRLPTIKCDLNVPYGCGEDELVDIYQPKEAKQDLPIFLFIHGGYWQVLSKNDYGHCAPSLALNAGYRVIIADYTLCPKGNLKQLVDQTKELFRFCLQLAADTNAKFLSVSGHSAGAHLILAALCDPHFCNQNELMLRMKLKHLYLISGVYDLTQLRFVPSINGNNILSLDDSNVKQLSPYFCDFTHLRGFKSQFHFVLGEHESDTFKQQSYEMMEILQNNVGLDTDYEVLRGIDHFNIIENLAFDNFYLTKRISKDHQNEDKIVTPGTGQSYNQGDYAASYSDETPNEYLVFSKSSFVK